MELKEESKLQFGSDTSIFNIVVKSESDDLLLNSGSSLCDYNSLPTTTNAIQLETDFKIDCPNVEEKPTNSLDLKPVLVQPAVFTENDFSSVVASTSAIKEPINGISECHKKETSDAVKSESFAEVSDISDQEEDYERRLLGDAEEEYTEMYTCGTCKKHSFKSVQQLRAHVRQNHLKKKRRKVATNGDDSSQNHFKKKRKKRRNVAVSLDEVDESHRFPTDCGDVAVCSICHQTFTDLSDLRTHITVHTKRYGDIDDPEATPKVKKVALSTCNLCYRPIPTGLRKAHRIVCTAKFKTDIFTKPIRCETFECSKTFRFLSNCLDHREMCIPQYCCLCFPDCKTLPLERCENFQYLNHILSLFDHIFRVHFADKILDDKLRRFIIKLICSKQMEEDLHRYLLTLEAKLDLATIKSLLKPLDLLKIANRNLEKSKETKVSTNNQKLEEDNKEDNISSKKSTAGGSLVVSEEKSLENECELCAMTYKTFDELSIHYFQHENSTAGVRLKCERCDLEFLERSVFRKHRSQPHLIFCKWCQKRFRKQSTYHIHVQNKHTESCAELGIKAFDPLFCSVKLEPAD